MIEKILQNSKYNNNNPIILEDCTLFFRLNHFDIGKTYIFHKQKEYPFSTVGNLWLEGRIKTEYTNQGYFTTPFFTAEHFNLMNAFNSFNVEEIAIIGYRKKTKYYVSGISPTEENLDFSEGYAAKFSFLDFKKLSR